MWAWGCLGLLALGLALMMLGWEPFGRLCLFLVAASVLVRALRERGFQWAFTDGHLRRDRHPLGYWTFIVAALALTLLSLWMFVEELRQAGG